MRKHTAYIPDKIKNSSYKVRTFCDMNCLFFDQESTMIFGKRAACCQQRKVQLLTSTVHQTVLFSVDVDHTALFYWSTLTEKSAAVNVKGLLLGSPFSIKIM